MSLILMTEVCKAHMYMQYMQSFAYMGVLYVFLKHTYSIHIIKVDAKYSICISNEQNHMYKYSTRTFRTALEHV